MSRRLADLPHLLRRFAHSVRPEPPSLSDEAWAAGWLSDTEEALWRSLPDVDRAHTVAVARRVAEAYGDAVPPPWLMAAALLHDVGKAEARLGTVGRSVATLVELAGIRRAPGRLGAYLTYAERGADVLHRAGADPRVVAWAREHHRGAAGWSGAVPRVDAELLARADSA